MSIFLPMLGVVVTILAGWAMIRRYQTHIVLLFSGLILVAAAAFLAGVDILPKGVKPSGFAGFDIFNLLVSIGKKQASGIGFLIMAAARLIWNGSVPRTRLSASRCLRFGN